jgi:pimeloyl-ACP methyl ester carboxylesterase
MTARPNIVLVHGAWADGASWSAVMPTVVAGHSYGGQIITALGTDAPNAVGMVYIAGFGLDEGESIGAPLDQAPAGPALAHLDVDQVKAVEGSA